MEQEAVLRDRVTRIVEITADRRRVSLSGGEIVVAGEEGEAERIPLDEIAGMVAPRPGPSWTAPALAALTERGAGVLLRGANHDSQIMTWPVPNRRWPARIRAQLGLYPPFARHLLRQLERARGAQRLLALETMGRKGRLQALKAALQPHRGGNRANRRTPEQVEAEIARHYWPWLIGPGFRRNPRKPGTNAVVNCGHTALRIEATRAVQAAGLHPGHALRDRAGTGGLADDLMIPFRPVVDLAAAIFVATGSDRVDRRVETAFRDLMTAPLRGRRGPVQIRLGLRELAESLARGFETGEPGLEFRLPALQDPDAMFTLMPDLAG